VTIEGASASTTVLEPSSYAGPVSDTDSSSPQFYVVDAAPGTQGLKLKDLGVNGNDAISSLGTDGDGCGQDPLGIYFNEASGSINTVDVTGIDMPEDLFGCQGGQGIYVNSAPADAATVTMSHVSLTSTEPSTTTTAKLPAGTYSNDVVPVKAVPKGWKHGYVTVGGYIVSAKKDGTTAILITGTVSTTVKKGSTVNFDVNTPAFDKNGITCDDAETSCTISDSTIDGVGPNNGIAQNGIQFFGAASGTASGNTVTGNTWTGGGGSGNAASGILVLNSDTVTLSDNTVSDSDVNIYAGEIPAYGLTTSEGVWTINGNTVSGATSDGESAGEDGYGEGIQLDGTSYDAQVSGNTVTGSAQANVLLTGVSNAEIGGSGAGQGNTIEGSTVGAGVVLGGPSTECAIEDGGTVPGNGDCNYGTVGYENASPGWASTGDTVVGNTIESNGGGVIAEGAFAPTYSGLSPDPNAAYGNALYDNTWTGNLLANAADFSGQENSLPIENQWGPNDPNSVPADSPDNSCDPVAGGSDVVNGIAGNDLDYAC